MKTPTPAYLSRELDHAYFLHMMGWQDTAVEVLGDVANAIPFTRFANRGRDDDDTVYDD